MPDLEKLDFVTTEEINDVISQIDDKINQISKLGESNLKSQVKQLEEAQVKSAQQLEKKIKGQCGWGNF